MALKRRNFVLVVISSVTAAAAAASAALAQAPAPAGGAGGAPAQSASSIPDFTSAIWSHPMLGFEQPLSGPGPVVNTKRTPTGTSNTALLVGDYTNPILKPAAAEIVKKRGEISQSGLAFPDPDAMCAYEPVPYIFWNFEIQMLQRPDKVTILYNHDHEFREVRMNQPHPAKVVPSAHGDSVGHYEGDTLVIDTIGVKVGPYTMIDRLGTPYTEALHVVERYRLIDYEDAKDALARNEKENSRASGGAEIDPNYRGKVLQLHFTVEDPAVFTMPWTSTITYRPATGAWLDLICAENVHQYYADGRDAAVPHADKPDF